MAVEWKERNKIRNIEKERKRRERETQLTYCRLYRLRVVIASGYPDAKHSLNEAYLFADRTCCTLILNVSARPSVSQKCSVGQQRSRDLVRSSQPAQVVSGQDCQQHAHRSRRQLK